MKPYLRCEICGHNGESHSSVCRVTAASNAFTCPGCRRALPDVTGKHEVICDLHRPGLFHECQCVPAFFVGELPTFVSSFGDTTNHEKLRFILNRELLFVFAQQQHIETLLAKYFSIQFSGEEKPGF